MILSTIWHLVSQYIIANAYRWYGTIDTHRNLKENMPSFPKCVQDVAISFRSQFVKLTYNCFTEVYHILVVSADTVVIIWAYCIAWACSLQSNQRDIEAEIMSCEGFDLPAKWHVPELGSRVCPIKCAHYFLMLCFVVRWNKINSLYCQMHSTNSIS